MSHRNTSHRNTSHRNTSWRTPPATQSNEASAIQLTHTEAGWSCRLQQPLIIGRDAGCDLRINDAHIERRHAEIYPVGREWWIRDLGSAGGTFLAGEIVEAEPLAVPSEIRLGASGPILRLDGLADRSEV